MKKRLNAFVLALCLMALTCAAAFGADEPTSGFKNLSVETAYQDSIELTPLTDKDVTVKPSEGDYPGAVKMEIVYSAAQKDSEYALFVLTDDKAPTVDNIAYIDQQTAKDNTVTFTAYPKKLPLTATSADYHVYISSNTDASAGTGITSYEKVASFSYYGAATVIRGDVSGDGVVSVGDATMILEHVVEIRTLEGREAAAADVNGDEAIGVGDATMILERVVEMRDENFQYVD